MVFTFQAPGSVVSVTSTLRKKSPRNVSLHGLESLKADGQATRVGGVIKMCDCKLGKREGDVAGALCLKSMRDMCR